MSIAFVANLVSTFTSAAAGFVKDGVAQYLVVHDVVKKGPGSIVAFAAQGVIGDACDDLGDQIGGAAGEKIGKMAGKVSGTAVGIAGKQADKKIKKALKEKKVRRSHNILL